MSRFLHRLGRCAARRRRRVLLAWLLAVAALVAVGLGLGGRTSDRFSIPGTETQRAIDLLQTKYADRAGDSRRLVLHAQHGAIHDEANRKALAELTQRVAALPGVDSVTPVVTAADMGLRGDPSVGFVQVQYASGPAAHALARSTQLDRAANTSRAAGFDITVASDLASSSAGHKPGGSEVIGVGAAVLVLLVAFGSVVAMGLPIGTALVSLAAGLMLVTVGAAFTDVWSVAPTIAAMIGLGVGIDYALFIVTRHRENLRSGMTVEEAAGRAIATAGQAVLFAGATVVIAILGLAFARIPMVTSMGFASALVVAVSVLAALTLLPALLGFAGHRIDRLKLPMGRERHRRREQRGLARRWSQHVARRPWRYAAGSAVLLFVLAVPFASIRLGQADAGNDAPGSPGRVAYDTLARGFGPGFNGPLEVVVALGRHPDRAAATARVDAITRQLKGITGVAAALAEPGLNTAGDTALVTVYPASAPQSAQTQKLVHRIRHDVAQMAKGATGVERILVTGASAAVVDISDRVRSSLPLFIGAVLGLSILLLMAVFRSILVPLKAAAMNLLGIAAAYGVVVAIFQWGWAKHLFGVSGTVPIISFLPMFMFAILFGLSMDYEVFLMSRIREEYLRTGDNLASVSRGIHTTARVITAAAIIMVSVFGSFCFGSDPTVKMMGLGLAVAILLDATVIRMVLVPASMALLGRANWWLPRWLDRRLPRFDFEGDGGLPAPEMEATLGSLPPARPASPPLALPGGGEAELASVD